MSILVIARYNGQYLYLGQDKGQAEILREDGIMRTDDQQAAKEAAELLFPYYNEQPTTERAYNNDQKQDRRYDRDKLLYSDTFYQQRYYLPQINRPPGYKPRGFGWVAVVSDEQYKAFLKQLDYPNGLLCQMYDIELIPLNNDRTTEGVYYHMTPAHWGTGGGGT